MGADRAFDNEGEIDQGASGGLAGGGQRSGSGQGETVGAGFRERPVDMHVAIDRRHGEGVRFRAEAIATGPMGNGCAERRCGEEGDMPRAVDRVEFQLDQVS